MRVFFKAIVALSMVLAAMAASVTPAAANTPYPGIDPGLSVTFFGDFFAVNVGSSSIFFQQCGPVPPGVTPEVFPTVTDSLGNVIHTVGAVPVASVSSWESAVENALEAHSPVVLPGDDITVNFGPGCNSYTITVIDMTPAGPGIAIDSNLDVTMANSDNFGCGGPGFLVFDVDMTLPSGANIPAASPADDGSVDGGLANMLADWSSTLMDVVPALVPGDAVVISWSGECPGGSETVVIDSVAGSDVPADSSPLTRPALALAALALSTVAVLGSRRLKASRS